MPLVGSCERGEPKSQTRPTILSLSFAGPCHLWNHRYPKLSPAAAVALPKHPGDGRSNTRGRCDTTSSKIGNRKAPRQSGGFSYYLVLRGLAVAGSGNHEPAAQDEERTHQTHCQHHAGGDAEVTSVRRSRGVHGSSSSYRRGGCIQNQSICP